MILLIIKGFFIGLFMLIPGVSGGSIAIILNEYEEIIYHTSNIFKDFKKSFLYLFSLAVGGLLGLFVSSYFLDFFIKNYYLEVIYFFVGIMIMFVFNFIKKSSSKQFKLKHIFYIFLGILISLLINLIPTDLFQTNNLISLILLGILLAVALILPGISVSYIMLIFSCYEDVINAFKTLDVFYLFKLGVFLFLGILVTIKGLDYLMRKHKNLTNFLIVGFMIGSLVSFIKVPINVYELNVGVIFLLEGILIFLIFDKIFKIR